MKTLFKMMTLFTLLLCFISCNDDEDLQEKPMEVNYASIAGTWRLIEWNNEKMDEPRYSYITFERKAEEGKRSYKIYTNLNSAVSECISGAFELDTDEEERNIITGTYDYTLSTDDEWEHAYIITDLNSETMTWIAEDDENEKRIYVRCSEVPADIINGTRAAF